MSLKLPFLQCPFFVSLGLEFKVMNKKINIHIILNVFLKKKSVNYVNCTATCDIVKKNAQHHADSKKKCGNNFHSEFAGTFDKQLQRNGK